MIETKTLIEKFLDGQTSLQEERDLLQRLEQENELPKEWKAVKMMLSADWANKMVLDEVSLAKGEAEFFAIKDRLKKRVPFVRVVLPVAVTAAAVVIGAIFHFRGEAERVTEESYVAKTAPETSVTDEVPNTLPINPVETSSKPVNNIKPKFGNNESKQALEKPKYVEKKVEAENIEPKVNYAAEKVEVPAPVEPDIIKTPLAYSVENELKDINESHNLSNFAAVSSLNDDFGVSEQFKIR